MPRGPRYPIIDGKQCCTHCLRYQDFSQFKPLSTTKSGRHSWCRECSRIGGREWNKRYYQKTRKRHVVVAQISV